MLPLLLTNLLSHIVPPRLSHPFVTGYSRGHRTRAKPINLALQGGGVHGAFTWGVLDQLLEDGRVRVERFSGALTGSVDAVMLLDVLVRVGPEQPRPR